MIIVKPKNAYTISEEERGPKNYTVIMFRLAALFGHQKSLENRWPFLRRHSARASRSWIVKTSRGGFP